MSERICPKCRHESPPGQTFCGVCGTKLDAAPSDTPRSGSGSGAGAGAGPSFTRTIETPAAELGRGTLFGGRYEIIEALGEGGMGKVYRAFDLRIRDEVAIKVLRPEISADKKIIERFSNELKFARQITHKNVCRMHEFHEDGQTFFITMEYVRGEDLKRLIRRTKQLAPGTAVSIAKEICEGLAEAHNLGLVHRDLKPQNIMVDGEGNAKIMDFGIARSLRVKGLTGEGAMIGTLEYMSPEQVEGREADQRADIYAVGVILYEMVTGQVPFDGDTPLSVALKHKTETPRDPREINPQLPSELGRVILKCLAKDKEKRYQSAIDLISDLGDIQKGVPAAERLIPSRPSATSREITVKFTPKKLAIPAAIMIAVLAFGGYFIFRGGRRPAYIQLGRQQPVTHEPGLEIDPALSPDGKMIAYAAGPPNKMSLYVRALTGGRTIALTEDFPQSCRWPQWSPDGSKIAFQSGDSIYTVPYLGGTAKKLIEPAPGKGMVRCAAWSPDGRRVAYIEGLSRICALPLAGGDPRTIIEPKTGAEYLHSLAWSPDGLKIAYVLGNWDYLFSYDMGNIAASSIWVAPVEGGDPVRITGETSLNMSPAWLPGGRRLLYVSNKEGSRDIYEIHLDASGKPSGPAVRLTTGLDAFTISLSQGTGKFAYAKFNHNANIWSVGIPSGRPTDLSEAQPVTIGSQTVEGMDVSPDGKWLAFDTNLNGNQDIYRLPLADGAAAGEVEQLTTDPSDDIYPAWSPDGTEIAFYSFRAGTRDIFLMKADGAGVQPLTGDPGIERAPAWSPDGLQIAFDSDMETPGQTMYLISRKTKESPWGRPIRLEKGWDPKWSPDGRLIVHVSRVGARNFQGYTVRVISPLGAEPRILFQKDRDPTHYRVQYAVWSPDSRTIYCKALDKDWHGNIWSVPLAGGEPKILVRLVKPDDPFLQSPRDELAIYGGRFYFTMTKFEADIWQVGLLPGK